MARRPPKPKPVEKRRTGRRSRVEELGLQEQLKKLRLPDISKAVHESAVIAYTAAVNRALCAGTIPAGWAKELNQGASIVLRAIRSRKSSEELDRYEALIRREEALEAARRKRAAASRQHRDGAVDEKPQDVGPPTGVIEQALAARTTAPQQATAATPDGSLGRADVALTQGDHQGTPSASP